MTTFELSGTDSGIIKITDAGGHSLRCVKAHIVDYYVVRSLILVISKTNGDARYKFKTEAEIETAVAFLDSVF